MATTMKNTVLWAVTLCSSERDKDVSEEYIASIFRVEE
jgi:hypothetical protein